MLRRNEQPGRRRPALVGFSIDDDSASRAQARADAVRQAQSQAKQMADAAGVRLGRIHTQELTVMVEVVCGIDQ